MKIDDTPLDPGPTLVVAGSYVAFFAIFSFLAQPVLQFVPANDLIFLGGAMALLVSALWIVSGFAGSHRTQFICHLAAAGIVLIFFWSP
jgi:hypothetical protein